MIEKWRGSFCKRQGSKKLCKKTFFSHSVLHLTLCLFFLMLVKSYNMNMAAFITCLIGYIIQTNIVMYFCCYVPPLHGEVFLSFIISKHTL